MKFLLHSCSFRKSFVNVFERLADDIGFCHIASTVASVDEDGLDDTQIMDKVYSQYNIGINIKLQLTESPEQLTWRKGDTMLSSPCPSVIILLSGPSWTESRKNPETESEFSTRNIRSTPTNKEEISRFEGPYVQGVQLVSI